MDYDVCVFTLYNEKYVIIVKFKKIIKIKRKQIVYHIGKYKHYTFNNRQDECF